MDESVDVAVIGAGSIGISVAYYLFVHHGVNRIALIDPGDAMGLTSAQSGENYRNWWPHPAMTAFTDHAIGLLEEIARASGNRIAMTRRGYVLATRRAQPDDLVAELHRGYGAAGAGNIRIHGTEYARSYRPADRADWDTGSGGVDVLLKQAMIRATFPSLAPDVATILHIRRAGDISGQQLGQYMLETLRPAGVKLVRAAVTGIETKGRFTLTLEGERGRSRLTADRIVNAAGPALVPVAAMLGETLPVTCIYQQKIAFEDRAGAIPRTLPFTIDLDEQQIAWTDDERAILAAEPDTAHLLRTMPGGIHRRPEGGDRGTWVKLGWAYNTTASDPAGEPPIDPAFPDIVLRGAIRLTPSLGVYLGRLPRAARHYGGYYTMTEENWPLIGPMRTAGAFVAGALSGFGTMAATATGALCAGWMMGTAQPAYAPAFTLGRYDDPALMAGLRAGSKGVL